MINILVELKNSYGHSKDEVVEITKEDLEEIAKQKAISKYFEGKWNDAVVKYVEIETNVL